MVWGLALGFDAQGVVVEVWGLGVGVNVKASECMGGMFSNCGFRIWLWELRFFETGFACRVCG